jgi:hypothetical protein
MRYIASALLVLAIASVAEAGPLRRWLQNRRGNVPVQRQTVTPFSYHSGTVYHHAPIYNPPAMSGVKPVHVWSSPVSYPEFTPVVSGAQRYAPPATFRIGLLSPLQCFGGT